MSTATMPQRRLDTKRESSVEHLFWVETMELASAMGVEMRSVCGRYWSSPSLPVDATVIECDENGVLLNLRRDDCKLCVRATRASYRRQLSEARA